MSKQAFDKFINQKSPAKVKEEHRQEKRKSKAALRAAGDELRRAKLDKQRGKVSDEPREGSRSYGTKPGGSFNRGGEARGKGKYESRRTKDGPREGTRFSKPRPGAAPQDADAGRTAHRINPNFGVKNERYAKDTKDNEAEMPLNKFIAHSGICSRREAAELVKQGQVQVNGDIVFEPAIKVTEADIIKLKGKKLNIQQKLVYFLLNKPKDHITTTKDDKGRKTVMDLFKDIDDKHVFPVGRLDRNTTGVLLLTNDGELAQQLTHPSFEVKKIYEATLDKPLTKKDAEAIATGITLEDGEIKADSVGYADPKNKAVIGIEIHSGKNRIVRRIFEHLGYEVTKLDRVLFAGLTKKNVERGKWRYLAEKEIRTLKYMNGGGTKKSKAVEEGILTEPETSQQIPEKAAGAKRKRIMVPKDGPTDHVKARPAAKPGFTDKRESRGPSRGDSRTDKRDPRTDSRGPSSKKDRRDSRMEARDGSRTDNRTDQRKPKPASSGASSDRKAPARSNGANKSSGAGKKHSVRSIKTHKE